MISNCLHMEKFIDISISTQLSLLFIYCQTLSCDFPCPPVLPCVSPSQSLAHYIAIDFVSLSLSPVDCEPLEGRDQIFWFFLFFTFLAALQPMEFLGQGSKVNQICNLCHSCSKAGSLIHCTRQESNPHPCLCRDTIDLVAPQQEFPKSFFIYYFSLNTQQNH